MNQIKKLSTQVTELSAALEVAKTEQGASLCRKTKILRDMKSPITTNAVNGKQQLGAVAVPRETRY